MIRDLGLELEPLARHRPDILDIIQIYGHGDCHLLTNMLAEEYGLDIVVIMDEDSGFPVHSAVILEGDITFDAYGINTLATTFERYKEYVWSEFEGTPVASRVMTQENLALHVAGFDEDDYQQAHDDAQWLAEFLGTQLQDLAASARRYGLAA